MSIIQEVLNWKVMICIGIGLFGFVTFSCSTFMFEKFFDYLGFATPLIVFFYLILIEKLKSKKK